MLMWGDLWGCGCASALRFYRGCRAPLTDSMLTWRDLWSCGCASAVTQPFAGVPILLIKPRLVEMFIPHAVLAGSWRSMIGSGDCWGNLLPLPLPPPCLPRRCRNRRRGFILGKLMRRLLRPLPASLAGSAASRSPRTSAERVCGPGFGLGCAVGFGTSCSLRDRLVEVALFRHHYGGVGRAHLSAGPPWWRGRQTVLSVIFSPWHR
jgi:hypothetical protein